MKVKVRVKSNTDQLFSSTYNVGEFTTGCCSCCTCPGDNNVTCDCSHCPNGTSLEWQLYGVFTDDIVECAPCEASCCSGISIPASLPLTATYVGTDVDPPCDCCNDLGGLNNDVVETTIIYDAINNWWFATLPCLDVDFYLRCNGSWEYSKDGVTWFNIDDKITCSGIEFLGMSYTDVTGEVLFCPDCTETEAFDIEFAIPAFENCLCSALTGTWVLTYTPTVEDTCLWTYFDDTVYIEFRWNGAEWELTYTTCWTLDPTEQNSATYIGDSELCCTGLLLNYSIGGIDCAPPTVTMSPMAQEGTCVCEIDGCDCEFCPDGSPEIWRLTLGGFESTCSAFNLGEIYLSQTGSCTWQTSIVLFDNTVMTVTLNTDGVSWFVTVSQFPTILQYTWETAFTGDCCSNLELTTDGSITTDCGIDAPVTITVEPYMPLAGECTCCIPPVNSCPECVSTASSFTFSTSAFADEGCQFDKANGDWELAYVDSADSCRWEQTRGDASTAVLEFISGEWQLTIYPTNPADTSFMYVSETFNCCTDTSTFTLDTIGHNDLVCDFPITYPTTLVVTPVCC